MSNSMHGAVSVSKGSQLPDTRTSTATLKRWNNGEGKGWKTLADDGSIWAYTTDDSDEIHIYVDDYDHTMSRERAEDFAEALGELLF